MLRVVKEFSLRGVLIKWLPIVGMFFFIPNVSDADKIYWNNTSGGNWSNTGNWNTGTTPGSTDSVFITVEGTYTVTLDMDVTVKYLTVGASNGIQTISADGRVLTINNTFIINSNGFLKLKNSSLSGAATLTNTGTIEMENNSSLNTSVINYGLIHPYNATSYINGTFSNTSGATLRVEGNPSGDGTTLTIANGFVNKGVIEIRHGFSYRNAILNVTNGTLVNAAGATIQSLEGDGSGTVYLNAQLDNQGTLSASIPLEINKASAAHSNSGTINVSGANITLVQSGTDPGFTNTGTINISSGRTLFVNGGKFTPGSGISGYVQLSSVTLGSGTVSSNTTFQLLGTSSVAFDAQLVNEGLIHCYGSTVNMDGVFSNASGATLRIEGHDSGDGANVTIANGFTNNGAIEIRHGFSYRNAILNVTNGTLVNAAGATIQSLEGSGNGTVYLNAQLDNRGTLSTSIPLEINKASAAHLNSGTININGADLFLVQSGDTPTFTNTGIIDISSNRTFTISGGTFGNEATGTLRGNGNLNVSGTSFTNNGTINPGASPGILTITGNLSQETSAVVNIEIGGLTAGTQFDQLNVTGNVALAGTLSVSLINNFIPAVGDSIQVIKYGSYDGGFSAIRGHAVDNEFYLEPGFGSDGLLLVNTGPPPDISISPLSLSVQLETGETSTRTLTVSNTGQADLPFQFAITTNYALNFDGVDDYVQVADADVLDITGEITIEAWYKPENITGSWRYQRIVTKPHTTCVAPYAMYSIEHTETNKLSFVLSDANYSEVFLRSATTIENGNWYYVAGTYDGSKQRLYLNGVEESSVDRTITIGTNDQPLFIGAAPGSCNEYFDGTIREVRIWNRALTQEEIQANMNRVLTGSEEGLVGYWRLDEGSGTTVEDLSGNGNTGTLVNGPMWVPSDAPIAPIWLDLDPDSGTVQPGSSINVNVSFNANGLDTGSYKADLVVSSNDPDDPEIWIPVDLTVFLPNRAPVAVNDTIVTSEDSAILIPVLANDSDPDGDAFMISAVSKGAHGSAVINPGDTTVTYTPNTNYSGADTFIYVITDGALSDTGMVLLSIVPVNDAPLAFGLLYPASGDTVDSLVLRFLWQSAADPDFDPLVYLFRLSGAGRDTMITGISDTVLVFDGSGFFAYDTVYTWYVEVTDSVDTTESRGRNTFRTPVILALGAVSDLIPGRYLLEQNYPNPFNPVTTIRYGLPVASKVELVIFDLLGREVIRLTEENQPAGYYGVVWNGRDKQGVAVPSGLYFYRMLAEDINGNNRFVATRRFILLK